MYSISQRITINIFIYVYIFIYVFKFAIATHVCMYPGYMDVYIYIYVWVDEWTDRGMQAYTRISSLFSWFKESLSGFWVIGPAIGWAFSHGRSWSMLQVTTRPNPNLPTPRCWLPLTSSWVVTSLARWVKCYQGHLFYV